MIPARAIPVSTVLAVAAILVAAKAMCRPSGAGFGSDGNSQHATREVEDRAFEIGQRGLEWLAKQQAEDGQFNKAKSDTGVTSAPVAVTALSALAFMAGGSTLGRGPYRENVQKAIQFLMKCGNATTFTAHRILGEDKAEDIDVNHIYFSFPGDGTSKMHGHGYATLALAEAYGTYRIDDAYGDGSVKRVRGEMAELRRILVDAVQLIEWSQTKDGGWYYEPGDAEHEGSVTITMIQALRAARDVGIYVNKQCIDDAVKYVRELQRPSGAFCYSKMMKEQVSYGLTAAAIATLNATGDYASDVIDRGIEYMQIKDPVLNPSLRTLGDTHPFYARLYAAEAYYLYRDPSLFRAWQTAIVDEFAESQDPKGSIGESDYGRVYSTASACLILLMPQQYLPIFQK